MKVILISIIMMLFSCAVCFGQETERASSMNLTGASLPAGAQRVRREYVPAQIDRALENWVSASDGKLRRGETEVLLWTGSDLRKTGAATIANRLTDTLRAAGWRCQIGGVENDITFFSLLKDGANPRVIVGLYGEADGTLIFALTELHPNDGRQSTPNPTSNTPSYSGSVADYDFTAPAGWSRSASAGKIVLSRDGDKKIEFLPLTDSSGDLERDAEKIIWQVFRGHEAWASNGFEAGWGKFEKGRTAQGLEYFCVYRYLKKIGEESAFSESRCDATLLLVKLGDKVAVITGSQPFQTDYSKGTARTAIDFILYSLTFKNVNNTYDLKNDLLGSWSSSGGGGAALAYTFNANGTFHKGAASEFRTPDSPGWQKVQTKSYGMTQTYSVSGNLLTQNYKQTGQVSKYRIRIYQSKYDKDAWKPTLGLLPVDSDDDGGGFIMKR